MSSVTLFELQCGAKTEKHFEDILKLRRWIDTVSFDDEVAEISSKIYQSLKRDNMMIEFRDIFIAATAVAMNLHVATLNRKHFERISDIVLLEI